MPGDYYFGDRPDQSKAPVRKILIGLCLFVLLFSAVTFAVILNYDQKLSAVLPAFENYLDVHEYDNALKMYRDIQAEVLTENPDAVDSGSQEKQVLNAMEVIVYSRVDATAQMIRFERYVPGADDRAFLEQMGELTGARLTLWLEGLCGEFLLGTIEKPTLEFIFLQIGEYSNVKAAAEPLRNEIDTIEKYRGDVQTAEKYFLTQSYIEAVEKFEEIVNSATGFVNTYAQARLQECQKVMYDPIMQKCDMLLENYKYYTAENILSDMARIFPNDQKVQAKLLEATSNTSPVFDYAGTTEVICMKPLISDTKLAFSSENVGSTDSLMITAGEFKAILEQLYAKNYILIDVRLMTDLSNQSEVLPKILRLPEGKKPIVIILENVNYSAYQSGKGLCSRIVLNDLGQICGEYKNFSGQTVISRDAEAIGILDTFVELHPDFSFDGAKGIISFSGYETVMGYITNIDQVDDRNAALSAVGLPIISPTDDEIVSNQTAVKSIMSRLKETGWTLASSTYGFINANICDMTAINNDTDKWMTQVGTLTGDVDVLVYPNGNFIKGSDPRCVFLKDNGFRVFFGVGPTPYYAFGDNYLYLDRAMLTGETLRNIDYSRLFSVSSIYDPKRTIQ